MIYATSDLHGYSLESFLRLLEKAGFGDSDVLYVLGDVIDRNGDGGIAMLRWKRRSFQWDRAFRYGLIPWRMGFPGVYAPADRIERENTLEPAAA